MSSSTERVSAAEQTLEILYEISQVLNTQLDKETLATCVSMIESGVNASGLAAVVQELRREKAAL
ncbi:mitotic-spindle organizing gamma-tubulin ring associated-domain-containing protein [Amanita rubescens]|nr:mitotic-spindle organizing gamma-tubulin ring associated-domain-containing protein [Amanita rubescens]